MNDQLLQAVRKLGISQTLRELRDYCHKQGEDAFGCGFEENGWYELYDCIDDIIPHKTDDEIDRENPYRRM